MTDAVIKALRANTGVQLSYTCSRYDQFTVHDVNIPEDLHAVIIGDEYIAVSSSDTFRFVEISPEQLRWLFMEAIDRGWYDE